MVTSSTQQSVEYDEIALSGADFFLKAWIDEIVVNDLEIRPLGVDSLEFDNEGVMEISFVTI